MAAEAEHVESPGQSQPGCRAGLLGSSPNLDGFGQVLAAVVADGQPSHVGGDREHRPPAAWAPVDLAAAADVLELRERYSPEPSEPRKRRPWSC